MAAQKKTNPRPFGGTDKFFGTGAIDFDVTLEPSLDFVGSGTWFLSYASEQAICLINLPEGLEASAYPKRLVLEGNDLLKDSPIGSIFDGQQIQDFMHTLAGAGRISFNQERSAANYFYYELKGDS